MLRWDLTHCKQSSNEGINFPDYYQKFISSNWFLELTSLIDLYSAEAQVLEYRFVLCCYYTILMDYGRIPLHAPMVGNYGPQCTSTYQSRPQSTIHWMPL